MNVEREGHSSVSKDHHPHHSHHHHSRSRSRASSRSRSRSRSHSHHRHRGHHRHRSPSRSPSPLKPAVKFTTTDPLSDYRLLTQDVVDRLQKGIFVHIYDLIRQPRLSSNPLENRTETKIGDNLFLSDTATKKKRTVKDHLDYFEVLFSSILPAQTQLIQQSTSVDNAIHHATILQKMICYALFSVVYFRKYQFNSVLKYLEAHREAQLPTNDNIDIPDIIKMHQMLSQPLLSNTSISHNNNQTYNNHASSSSSSSSSPSSSSSNSTTAQRKKGHTEPKRWALWQLQFPCRLQARSSIHLQTRMS